MRVLLINVLALIGLADCHWVFPYHTAKSEGDTRVSDAPLGDRRADDARGDRAAPIIGITVGTREAVDELNRSDAWETDPVLTKDGLTIYFTSTRTGNGDIYRATRSDPDLTFSTPEPVAGINSAGTDYFAVTPDDQLAVLSSNRLTLAADKEELWVAVRGSALTWSFAQFRLVDELNTAYAELDTRLSPDGLRLYYAPVGFGGVMSQQLVVAERPDVTQRFAPAALLLGVHAGLIDADPTLNIDETLLVFTSIRDGQKTTDLYYAVRPSRDKPFSQPQPLSGLNTPDFEERDPFITADEKWIYFTSTHTPTLQQDIFRAPLTIIR
jgi:Tol biopolymer transport system component